MENLFVELKRLLGLSNLEDALWILRRQLAAIQCDTAQLPQQFKRMERMNAEVSAKLAELRSTVQAESQEVQEVLKSSVAAAVTPLESQIAELKAQIEAGQDPTETLAGIDEAIAEVKAIVTPDATQEPTEDAPTL